MLMTRIISALGERVPVGAYFLAANKYARQSVVGGGGGEACSLSGLPNGLLLLLLFLSRNCRLEKLGPICCESAIGLNKRQLPCFGSGR